MPNNSGRTNSGLATNLPEHSWSTATWKSALRELERWRTEASAGRARIVILTGGAEVSHDVLDEFVRRSERAGCDVRRAAIAGHDGGRAALRTVARCPDAPNEVSRPMSLLVPPPHDTDPESTLRPDDVTAAVLTDAVRRCTVLVLDGADRAGATVSAFATRLAASTVLSARLMIVLVGVPSHIRGSGAADDLDPGGHSPFRYLSSDHGHHQESPRRTHDDRYDGTDDGTDVDPEADACALVRRSDAEVAPDARQALLERADALFVEARRGPPRDRLRAATAVGYDALSCGEWSTAADALGRAATCARELDEEPRLDLLLALTQAAFHSGDRHLASTTVARCHTMAADNDDREGLGWALLAELRMAMLDPLAPGTPIDDSNVLGYIEQHGHALPALCARLSALLAERAFDNSAWEVGRRHIGRAETLASAAADPATNALLYFAQGLLHFGELELDAADRTFERSEHAAELAGDRWAAHWGASRRLLIGSIRAHFDEVGSRAAEIAGRTLATGNHADYCIAISALAGEANVRGRFDEAERFAVAANEAAERSKYAFGPSLAFPELIYSLAARGEHGASRLALDEWAAIAGDHIYLLAGAYDSLAGVEAEPVALELLPDRLDVFGLAFSAACIDSRPRADHAEWRRVEHALVLAEAAGAAITPVTHALLARLLAVAAVMRDDVPTATHHLRRAVDIAFERQTRVELGRCLLLADELGLAGFGSAEPLLNRIGAHGLAAHASPPRTPPRPDDAARTGGLDPEQRVVVYTDIVGSTVLNDHVGDAAYLAMLQVHDALVRNRAADCGGHTFKHTGDGFGLWFSTADDAAAFASFVHCDLAAIETDDAPLRVRIGMTAGFPTDLDGDLFGLDVVRAVRVCAAASAGETLADAAAIATLGAGWNTERRGPADLKGFDEPVEIFALSRGLEAPLPTHEPPHLSDPTSP